MGQNRFGGKHAIVIGGSMTGMLTARVLADHFDQVTVIERDQLPAGPESRKSTPQARHAHGLLVRGRSIMERLLPGIVEEYVAAGAVWTDLGEAAWYHHGVWKSRFQSGMMHIALSRPLMEWKVRERVMALPNVKVMQGCPVTELLASPDRVRVTGVRLETDGGVQELLADLVVEAGGRGTRAPNWLTGLGYPAVESTEVKMNVCYASQVFKQPATKPDWKLMLQYSDPPNTHVGVIFPMEGDRWMVSLSGMFGEEPPTDNAGFLEFARTLPCSSFYEALRTAEPLTPVVLHRVPSNLRRRYERMARFPENFVVLGDAACSFNPLYGQGITTATLGVEALEQCLETQAKQSPGTLTGLSVRFQKQLAAAADAPWQAATGEDFRYAKTEGVRAPGTRFIQWYMHRINQIISYDQEVMRDWLGVVHMITPAGALFKPATIWKVLTHGQPKPAPMPQAAPGTGD